MGSSAAGSYDIDKSLRFNAPDDSYIGFTPSSTGSQKVWTWSGWVKRTKLGVYTNLMTSDMHSGEHNNGIAQLAFDSSDKLYTYFDTSGSNPYGAVNDAVFRDVGVWYHIVWQVDAANTDQKIWVNGVELACNSGQDPPDYSYSMNKASHLMTMGATAWDSVGGHSDLYLAEVHYIDGTKYQASDFGETDTVTGQWIPKEASGITYGTNGCYLTFSDNSNTTAATLGKDSAGSNNWTPTNFNTYDVFPDTPTNNFPIMNLVQKYYNITPTQGGLYTGVALGGDPWIRSSTFAVKGGKWFMELRIATGGYAAPGGSSSGDINFAGPSLVDPDSTWLTKEIIVPYSTHIYSNGGIVQSGLAGMAQGDVMSFAIDCDNFTADCWKNGSSYGSQVDWSGHSDVNEFFIGMNGGSGGTYWNSGQFFNYGQDSSFSGAETAGNNSDANGYGDFSMAVPSGYLALCSKNLPTPTIKDGTKYFNTVLYTGTGTTDQAKTVGFQPDLVWLKKRSPADDHIITDSVITPPDYLKLNTSEAQATYAEGIKSLDANGFTVGSANNTNQNTHTFASWSWKESASAGFDIVSYTGTGSATTISHSLGVKPEFILVKNRDQADGWQVQHKSKGATFTQQMDGAGAFDDTDSVWNDTEPTSSVFSVKDDDKSNASGEDYIAYLWAGVDGFSKAGSYIGNGLADGPVIHLGFKPAFLLVKGTGGSHWLLQHDKVELYNPVKKAFLVNANNAEEGLDAWATDFLTYGFKVRGDGANRNQSGVTFVYLAFASSPFKYANPR